MVGDGLNEGPASTRRRRLGIGILTAAGSRGIGAIVPLIIIPVTLDYLGAETYGLWMAITSLTGMAAFADLGLGNGLLTRLAHCHARNDTSEARRVVSTSYAIVLGVTAIALLALWPLSRNLPWGSLLNVALPDDSSKVSSIALVCLALFLINIPLSLVLPTQLAVQRIASANLWQASGALVSLPLVFLAVRQDLGPVVVVAAAVSGPPIANALNSVWLYGFRLREISPVPREVDRRVASELLRLAGMFFVLSIVMAIATNIDNIIIARSLGLTSVTEYSVPARIFAQLGTLAAIVNMPLWAANAEALARGEVDWVRRTTKRMSSLSGAIIAIPALVLVIGGDEILSWWVGSSLGATLSLLAGLATWWLLLAVMSPRFMVQNSVGIVAPQLVGWTLYLVLSIPLKVLAARSVGLAAIPCTGVLIYAVTVIPCAVVGYRRALAREPEAAPHWVPVPE